MCGCPSAFGFPDPTASDWVPPPGPAPDGGRRELIHHWAELSARPLEASVKAHFPA